MVRGSRICRWSGWLLKVVCACTPYPALAGPPFLTDDPEPTDIGHWEIYAPAVEMEGRGDQFEGTYGVEINYGAAANLQFTANLPLAYAHDRQGWRHGAGDIELSAKYRFFHDEDLGLQIAVFPGLTLPTATNGMGAGRTAALFPVWIQKDNGPWSIFGGGGYTVNPGAGNRNYWTGGVAVTRQISRPLLLGAEADKQGADVIGGSSRTSLGLGAIWQLKRPFRLLASGGPTFSSRSRAARYHLFLALGLDF